MHTKIHVKKNEKGKVEKKQGKQVSRGGKKERERSCCLLKRTKRQINADL